MGLATTIGAPRVVADNGMGMLAAAVFASLETMRCVPELAFSRALRGSGLAQRVRRVLILGTPKQEAAIVLARGVDNGLNLRSYHGGVVFRSDTEVL